MATTAATPDAPPRADGRLRIRPATRDDVSTLLRFIRDLAEYEREPDAAVATENDLLRDGFGERPLFEAMLAEWDGEPVGFAFYFFQYSTWTGRPVLYLEDIFVTPIRRKHGIGRAFMRSLAAEALARGCRRFQWAVLDWNAPAIAFYESLGARVLREWWTVRVDGEALARMADSGEARDGPNGDGEGGEA